MKKMTGADIVLKVLEKQGVKCVFGYPGGMMLPLYDSLFHNKQIKHYLVRHEQGAVHMAEGYARVTGEVGVVFVTSGPGATNTVTGLANAKLDSIPILVISAQVAQKFIGTDGFQEADVVGITIAATKHNDLVRDVNELEETLNRAFYVAKEGRPGPVLIDIPRDILVAEVPYQELVLPTFQPSIIKGDFLDAARALCEAKKPLCYFGGGVILANAAAELRELISVLNIPAAGTLMGLGAISGRDEHFIGMLGMHGAFAANMAIHDSDCILAVGVRFDDRVTGAAATFAEHARIIHIDTDESEIDKIKQATWPIVADAKPALVKMLNEVKTYLAEKSGQRTIDLAAWWQTIKQWQQEQPLRYTKSKNGEIIKPQTVIEEVYQQTGGDVIVATDVGQHQMWTAQFFPIHEPRTWLTSGGLGTMGFGLPAAIGAQIGQPAKQVIAFLGDGSIQMTIQELALMMNNQVPVKIVLLNNGSLGMVRQWQDLFYDERFSEVDISVSPDFQKIAEAYGIQACRVAQGQELAAGVAAMLAYPGSYLLEVLVDKNEHVYPMVPAGNSTKNMLLHPSF